MQSYAEIPNAKVVAVASRSRAAEFARRWGVGKYYTGEDFIEKLCSDKEVDAVDIVLPNFLHLKAVQVCAENKKNIIIEKPLGRNLSEAREMLNAVNRNGVLHAYAENQVIKYFRLNDVNRHSSSPAGYFSAYRFDVFFNFPPHIVIRFQPFQ